MQSSQSTPSSPPSRPGRKRLLLVICLIGVAAGLLVARPWQGPHIECSLTVQPGQSLQAAIDAAAAGDVICLARGTWTENIVIDKPLTLVGRGAGRTAIEAARFFSPVVQISGQDSEPPGIKLIGLTISGLGGVSGVSIGGTAETEIKDCVVSGRWYGVEVADSANLTMMACTISENTQRGVVLVDSARATISGSRISRNMGPALWLSGSAEATLLDCEISGNRGHGFWLRGSARVVLSNCSVSANGGHGLWLTEWSTAQLLQSRISGNSDQGIRADDSAGVELIECDVLSNWHGIELRAGAQATIVNCAVSRNRWHGISVQNSARATVSGSVISANRRGVGLRNQADAEIRDCLIEENSGYGVFSWSSSDIRGQGNRFRQNGVDLGGNVFAALRVPLQEPRETAIIWPDDRYPSLQEAIDALLPGGTLVIMPGTYVAGLTVGGKLSIEADPGGVTLQAKSSALPVLSLVDGAELHLARATITGGAEGLLVSAGAKASLVDCTISDNLQGISLSYASSAQMANCSIEGNAQGGVLASGAAQATITGCSISNSTDYGIAATDSARVTVMDSRVTGIRKDGGIVLRGSAQAVLVGNTLLNNRGFGVAIFQRPCFTVPWPFRGRISGSSNAFGANLGGDVCPPELGFLSTTEGGELDLRPSVSP